jgi:hypothetical protein
MKYLTAIALACLLATPASVATATPTLKVGRCLLKVDGRVYASGTCKIIMWKDGAFQIASTATSRR